MKSWRASSDIILGTTSSDSSEGRPRGSEATKWHQREPQAPEGKETALCDYPPTRKQENVRGLRLALATTALRLPSLILIKSKRATPLKSNVPLRFTPVRDTYKN